MSCPREGYYTFTRMNSLNLDLAFTTLSCPLRERTIHFSKLKLAIISEFLPISLLTSDPLPRPYSSALTFYLETIFRDFQPTGTDK